MFGPVGLAPLARLQLAAWEDIARDWPLYLDGGQQRCASCHAGVFPVSGPDGKPYQWAEEQILANVVRHLRARHAELDPDHE